MPNEDEKDHHTLDLMTNHIAKAQSHSGSSVPFYEQYLFVY